MKYKLQKLKFKVQKEQRGFTLIELIIYIGLLTVMIFILSSVFITILDNQTSSRDTSNVAVDGRYIYSRFIYDVNRATSISSPAQYNNSSQSMTLTVDGQDLTYAIHNNNLTLTDATGEYALNGEGTIITNLSFTKIGTTSAKPTIQIVYTVRGKTPSRGVINEQHFQTTAGLR